MSFGARPKLIEIDEWGPHTASRIRQLLPRIDRAFEVGTRFD